MAVTNNFSSSTLDLNGEVALKQPTALVWGPDGRLFVTEVDGDVKVLSVAFGDRDPGDGDAAAQFYVTGSVTLDGVKSIPNYNDDGTSSGGSKRQITGIDVTPQFDAGGEPMSFGGKPAVTLYVTSSDSRIGAGTSGADANLDTNSGVITKLTQTGPDSWSAVDLVRGLARSEENHALNGLEVIQTIEDGRLVAERLIVANGGNANSGAPSNNFAGQQEQPFSGAILEVDLDMLAAMPVLTDPASGRSYVYDAPTLDDPTRAGADDAGDPWGGNDGLNSAKLVDGGPVRIYSPGYRNAYDVEVTDDGRVFTYDNGANDTWGGRPVGEAGDDGATTDFDQAPGYIATNLNNGDGDADDPVNLVNWNPSNKDQLHEVTRSDDLGARSLSAGQGGARLYADPDTGLTYVYGGHPNPTRAEGARAGLLFSPKGGADDAFLLVSDGDSYGEGRSDHEAVLDWFSTVEADDAAFPDGGVYGAEAGELASRVLAVTPGVSYDILALPEGGAAVDPAAALEAAPEGAVLVGTAVTPDLAYDVYALAGGGHAAVAPRDPAGVASAGTAFLGRAGLPADIAEIVAERNPIEGNYFEAGRTDGAIDSGNGSINGLTEYTSTVLDAGAVKMSGALIAASLNQGSLIVIGRDADGVVQTGTNKGFTVAAERTTLSAGGGPLGLAAIGDDHLERGLGAAFQGSIWAAVYQQNGPLIEIFQPKGVGVPLAGSEIVDETDADLDGLNHVVDPFEFSAEGGFALAAGESLVLDFAPLNDRFPESYSGTGLLGAALDGRTPNRDARTAAENFGADQQRDGLFDAGGNIIPGGNAPIFQIKRAIDGTAVGAANTARDAMQTGFRPADDVRRIEAVVDFKNWIPASGGAKPGQLTGLMFGDGTQANFVRVVFGSVNGEPGIEVGYELGDSYTALAQVGVPALAEIDVSELQLRLEITGIGEAGGFDVAAGYRLEGRPDFTDLPLGGFKLPAGVLRDVLTGDHVIGSGAAARTSGAALGVVVEDAHGDGLDDGGLRAVDVYNIEIRAFGNEILADTAAEVGAAGTPGRDEVIYTGEDTQLALAPDVEVFDGRGSAADYAIAANDLANTIVLGAGANTVTTGGGADTVRGTLAQLDGDTITDFSADDELVIEGASASSLAVSYAAAAGGGATVTVNGATIAFEGPAFEGFVASDGARMFGFQDVEGGVRLTVGPALAPVVAINAGEPTVSGAALRDTKIDFVADTSASGSFSLTGTSKSYSNGTAQGFDFPGTELDAVHASERSSNSASKWGYAIDVADGTYLVDLLFAEIFHGLVTTGDPNDKRQFDVFLEGALVADDYDIIDAAGGAGKEAILSYEVEVTDGTLDIEFLKQVDQAKLSGLAVWALGGTYTPPADTTAPEVVSIAVSNPPSVQDLPLTVTVVVSDEAGFEQAALEALTGSELTFSDILPAAVSAPSVALSNGGRTATLSYTLTPPADGWPSGEGQVAVAAGAYADAAGNASAAAQSAFIVEPNLGNLVPGAVALAINVGPEANAIDAALAGDDKNTYGGAIANDPIIGVDLQADDPSYYSPSSKTGSNIDGKFGPTGSNPELDGSALHTYRDSAAGSFTATYPIANGVYVVELWFAELYWDASGKRQGDYAINGETVAMDFDAFAAAGGADEAVRVRQTITVTDGKIVVDVNADAGQPGYNAIVVYEAVPSDLPPTVSVADAQAVEGGEALITFTRAGDLSEAVQVSFELTPGTADAGDFGAPSAASVTIAAGERTATATVPIANDDAEEGAEAFGVAITGVSNAAGDAQIGDGAATVTIAPSDGSSGVPSAGALFALDFEAGDPIGAAGFDAALGGAGALEAGKVSVAGGKLVIQTSDGDLSSGAATASKNDLVRAMDVSDAAIDQVTLATRFDNPFQSGFGTSVADYAQQGIIMATGDVATQQNANQFVKLVWGGNDGTVVQMWSQGVIDQIVPLSAMSAAAGGASFGLADIASVELALGVDKAAGTVAQFVTLRDASGAVLGGVRPEATPGFALAPAQAMPAAVAAAVADGSSVFGVTSSDFGSLGSFSATWDFLDLTSPQVSDGGPVDPPAGPVEDDAFDGAVIGDLSDDAAAPTSLGTLALGESELRATQQGPNEEGGRDYDYVTFTVAPGQQLDALTLSGFETEGTNAGFLALVEGAAMDAPPSNDFDAQTAFAAGLLGGTLVAGQGGVQVGGDLLGKTGLGSGEVQGLQTMSFDAPLGAGTYTLWFSQGGTASTATLQFQVSEAFPMATTLSIADAASVTEGDDGSSTLVFALSASDDFTGEIAVTFDAGAGEETRVVAFTNGAGALEIEVADDDVDDGDDTVNVTLTGAAAGGEAVAIGAASASGVVIEDDATTPSAPQKGALAFALNVGGGAVTGADGTDYEADSGAGWSAGTKTYGAGTGADFDGDGDADGDDAVYATERYDDAMTYTRTGLAPGDYVLTLKFAEIYAAGYGDGNRVFDVSVNGTPAASELDLFDVTDAAFDAHDIEVPVTVGADGTLSLSFNASADNAKVNALTLHEAVGTTEPGVAVVSVADASASESDGTVSVTVSRMGDLSEDVVVNVTIADGTAEAGADYAAPVESTVTIPAGQTAATIDVSLIGDEVEEVSETFTVTITGAQSAGGAAADIGAAVATVTITDDDQPAPAAGAGPDEDLDGDGIANAADADVDGDGVPDEAETFRYDATDAGRALRPGETVTLDFATDGTPWQNGLTGALVSAKSAVSEVDLEDASVSGGALTIKATAGDHYRAVNSQQNAFVTAVSAQGGLRVETVFAAPDFDPADPAQTVSQNYQAAGVVIGTGQDALVKAVFGRAGPQLQLAEDKGSAAAAETTTDLPAGFDYAQVVSVVVALEVFVDAGAAKAKGSASFLGADGAPLAGLEAVSMGQITLTGPVAATVLAGAPLGAGVIQTSTGSGTEFDVAYDSLTVTALGDPSGAIGEVTISGAPSAAEAGDEGTAAALDFVLATTGADGPASVSYTVNGGAERTADVAFEGGAATLTVEVAGDDEASDGSVTVALTNVDGDAVLGAATTATGTLTEDDFAPVADGGVAAQEASEGVEFQLDLGGVFSDLDSEVLTLSASLADGAALPAWLAFDPTTGSLSGTPSDGDAGTLAIALAASDGTNTAVTTVDLVVAGPATNLAPTATPIDAGAISEADAAAVIDLLVDAGATDADGGTLGVTIVSVTDGAGADVAYAQAESVLTIDPAQFADALATGETATVTVAYLVTDGQGGETPNTAVLTIDGADDAITWHLDADRDGYGVDRPETNLVAADRPADTAEGGQYAALAGDADDANAAVYPGAPEVNDGLDNDQDGETDEDNAAPVADGEGLSVAAESSVTVAVAVLLDGDTDADGDALEVVAVAAEAAVGTATLDAEAGTVTFTPAPGHAGPASFTYTVSDGFGGFAEGTVSVDVVAPVLTLISVAAPAAPVLEGGDAGIDSLVFSLTASDPAFAGEVLVGYSLDGGITTLEETVSFADGSATLSIGVAQDDLADGPDAVTVTLTAVGGADVTIGTGSATASIEEDDFAPVATDDGFAVSQGESVSFDPAFNDVDADLVDGAALLVTAIDTTATVGGTVTLEDDGTVTVTAGPDATGTIAFGYTVSDPAGNTAIGTASVAVTEASDTLVVIEPSATAVEDGDEGTTTVGFAIATTPASAGTSIEVGFAVGEGAVQIATVELDAEGRGVLSVEVAGFNDAVDDGSDEVSVTLTGVSTAGFALGAGVVATAMIAEDDAVIGAPPVFDAGTPSSVSVRENTTAVVTVAATGADGDAIVYGLDGADAAAFTIDAATGAVAFAAAPDFEAADGRTRFEIAVTATSNGLTASRPITIDVADVLEVTGATVVEATGDLAAIDLGLGVDGQAVATEVVGTAQALNALPIANFGQEDRITVTGLAQAPVLLSVGQGPVSLNFDTDGVVGTTELTLTLEGGASGDGDLLEPADFDVLFDGGAATVRLARAAPPVEAPQPVRIQAEAFDDLGAFYAENQGAAQGGEVIRLASGGSGVATVALDGKGVRPGTYVLSLDVFDENDGRSDLGLTLVNNGVETAIGAATLDLDAGGNAAQATSKRTLTFRDVVVREGDELKITGGAEGGEFVRIDAVRFEPAAFVEGNQAPQFNGVIADVVLTEETPFALDLLGGVNGFTDVNEDDLTLTVDNALFTIEGGVLSANPTNEDALGFAGPVTVTVTATDPGGLSASRSFLLADVVNVNDAPEIGGPAIRSAALNRPIAAIDVAALVSDADGDAVTLTIDGLPVGLVFENGAISGTPTAPGSSTVTITADDGQGGVTTREFRFDVTGAAAAAEPVRLQAEAFELDGYIRENPGASDGGAIRLASKNGTGTASLQLDGTGVAPGANALSVTVFDENDGASALTLRVVGAGGTTFEKTVTLDRDGGGNAAQAANLRTIALGSLDVAPGDRLVIEAVGDGGEFVRVDHVEFTAIASGVNFGPMPVPGFEPDGVLDVTAGVPFDLGGVFSDPEEDALTYAVTAPGGGAVEGISIVNGQLVVGEGASGRIDVVVSATDAGGSAQTAARAFTLDIAKAGSAPVISAPLLGEVPATSEDQPFNFAVPTEAGVVFDDADGDALTLSAHVVGANGPEALPGWLSFEGGVFSGTPAQDDVGAVEIAVVASDGVLSSAPNPFTLTVENVNDAPVVAAAVADRAIKVGEAFRLSAPGVFADEDPGDALTYSVTGLPAGLAFDAATGEISGSATAAGNATVTITATDRDGATVSDDFALSVVDPGFSATPVTLEAESFGLRQNFRVFNAAHASEGKYILVRNGQAGVAEVALKDVPASVADLKVTIYDEDDGISTLDVMIVAADGTTRSTSTITFDATDGTKYLNSRSRREVTIEDVVIREGDTLRLSGQAQGAERLGVDKVVITPKAPAPVEGSTSVASIAAAATVVENGAEGATLEFPVSFDVEPSSAVTLEYTVSINDGAPRPGSAAIAPTGGVIAVTVPGDEVADGDDTVVVTLTGVAAGRATIGAASTAQGAVVEDDVSIVPVATIAGPAAPVAENGDAGDTTVAFAVSFDVEPDAPVTVSYVESVDGVASAEKSAVIQPGGGTITVLVPSDDADDGDEAVSVTLTGVAAGSAGLATIGAAATATATVTDDDASIAAPRDTSPAGDLDGDGAVNSADADVDGDGVPNVDDAYAYDAQDGRALADGESLLLEFDTPGTPWQNGLTGALQSPTTGFEEVTGGATVSDGALVVPTSNGDAGGADTANDAFVTGIKCAGDFSVETRVDNPFDAPMQNYQQFGLVVGLDQANFLKFVLSGSQFELVAATGNAENPKSTAPLPGDVAYADIEAFVFDLAVGTTGAPGATGTVTLLGANDAELATIVIGPHAIGTGPLAAALADPASAVGVGVTQSHHNGKPAFDATYRYLRIDAPQPSLDEEAPTATIALTDPADAEGVLGVAVSFADASGIDGGSLDDGDLTLLADGEAVDASVRFDAIAGDVARYSIAAPAGGWAEGASYSVRVEAGEVLDLAAAPNGIEETTSQAFTLDFGDTDGPTQGRFGPSGDFDADGTANGADADIDGDGLVNLDDRAAYDATDAGTALAEEGEILIDFAAMADGASPFEAGFTGVAQTADGSPELDYATDNGARVRNGRLEFQTTDDDTNDGDSAFTFLSKVGGDFTFEGVFDNPVFGAGALGMFSQYGLIISMTGAPGASGGSGGDFLKLVTGNPGAGFELSGKGSVSGETKMAYPAGVGPTEFKQVKLTLQADAETATLTGRYELYDEAGQAIGAGTVGTASAIAGSALFETLTGANGAAIPAFGITSTDIGGGGAFTVAVESVKLTGAKPGAPTDVTLANTSVPENQAGAVVGVLSAEEPDGDAITWSVDDGRFEVVGDTLKLREGVSLDREDAASVIVEVTATDSDGSLSETFTLGVQNDPSDDAPAASAREILAGANGVTTTDSYGAGAVGSAVLKILSGQENIQLSNFGAGSFQLENTGDKKIAAVFLDVRGAIYPDSVFDDDGSGGDAVARDFSFTGGSDASALAPSGYEHFFLPARAGADPLFASDKQDSGKGADGGWRGLLLKFDDADNGFAKGESVAFAGDMDPNSIAGLQKATVDDASIPRWDVGGVSGAELIGSKVMVMFSDGTIAEGQLHGDGSQAGSQALISQAIDPAEATASLTVNGVADGGVGTYGGEVPSVVVDGPAGATVRVVMTKGFDPVGNQKAIGGTTVDQLVADRLKAYDFEASNAAEFQAVDVRIPSSGSVDVGALFSYGNAPNGNGGVPDFDKLQLGFAAAVIDPSSKLPVGPVSDAIYLENDGRAVSGGATTPPLGDAPGVGEAGYYEAVGSGSNARYKVQIEDANANGGQSPGGKWDFVDASDEAGRQSGFQGDGYYLYGSDTSTAIGGVVAGEVLDYTIFVGEGETGTYSFRARVSRDGVAAGDQQNDLYLNFKAEGTNETFADYAVLGGNVLHQGDKGFAKIYGGPNNGSWGYAGKVDGEPNDPVARVQIDEPGFYTVQIAGRSQGYHVDFWELYKGSAPNAAASDSAFVPTGDTEPTVVDPIEDVSLASGAGGAIATAGTFRDLDGDALALSATIPAGLEGVSFDAQTGVFTVGAEVAAGVYALGLTATDDDGNAAADEFTLTIAEAPPTPEGPVLSFQVLGTAKDVVDAELEDGDSFTLAELGANPEFTGLFTSGSASSVVLELLDGAGTVLDVQTENLSPWDITYDGATPLGVGSYVLRATSYSGTGGAGTALGTQTFGFAIAGDAPGDGTVNAAPTVVEPIADVSLVSNVGGTITTSGTFADADGDALVLSAAIPAAAADFVTFADGIFTVGADATAGVYSLGVSASDGVDTVVDEFTVTITAPASAPPAPVLDFRVLGADGRLIDDGLETGDAYTSDELGDALIFSGSLASGSAASVVLELRDGQGDLIDDQIDDIEPFDIAYEGSAALAAGDYVLSATTYSGAGGTGEALGTQVFGFGVSDAAGGGSGPEGATVEKVFAIQASADDWEQYGYATSSDLEFGLNGSRSQSVGLRFAGVTVPEGAAIKEAFLRFEAEETSTGRASLRIEIEGTEAASSYSFRSRPENRAYADGEDWADVEAWSAGQTYRTPDISGLIETVIGADGIEDGALGFRVIGGTGNADKRVAHSWNSSTGDEPELVIVYEDTLFV